MHKSQKKRITLIILLHELHRAHYLIKQKKITKATAYMYANNIFFSLLKIL